MSEQEGLRPDPRSSLSDLIVNAPAEPGLPSEESAPRALESLHEEVKFRRRTGYLASMAGVFIITGEIAVNAWRAATPRPTTQVVAEAVVSLVTVYFGYALLRVAERMFLPSRFLLGGEVSPDAIKAFLGGGVRAPSEAAMRQLRETVGILRDTATGLRKSDGA